MKNKNKSESFILKNNIKDYELRDRDKENQNNNSYINNFKNIINHSQSSNKNHKNNSNEF